MFGYNTLTEFIFGRLTLEAIPYHEPILVVTFIGVALGGLAVLALITRFKLWGYLWTEWFTSVDHKKIGVMYMHPGDHHAAARLCRRDPDACPSRRSPSTAMQGFLQRRTTTTRFSPPTA
jgi:hypothetical protein